MKGRASGRIGLLDREGDGVWGWGGLRCREREGFGDEEGSGVGRGRAVGRGGLRGRERRTWGRGGLKGIEMEGFGTWRASL